MAQRMIDKEEAYTKIRNTRNFFIKNQYLFTTPPGYFNHPLDKDSLHPPHRRLEQPTFGHT